MNDIQTYYSFDDIIIGSETNLQDRSLQNMTVLASAFLISESEVKSHLQEFLCDAYYSELIDLLSKQILQDAGNSNWKTFESRIKKINDFRSMLFLFDISRKTQNPLYSELMNLFISSSKKEILDGLEQFANTDFGEISVTQLISSIRDADFNKVKVYTNYICRYLMEYASNYEEFSCFVVGNFAFWIVYSLLSNTPSKLLAMTGVQLLETSIELPYPTIILIICIVELIAFIYCIESQYTRRKTKKGYKQIKKEE